MVQLAFMTTSEGYIPTPLLFHDPRKLTPVQYIQNLAECRKQAFASIAGS